MSSGDVVELLTEADCDLYMSRPGVIVIHDHANGARSKRVAHFQRPDMTCSHVSAENFREKVLANAGRNGRYWWAKNSGVAKRELGATLCAESDRLRTHRA